MKKLSLIVLVVSVVLGGSCLAYGQSLQFRAGLSGAQEVPEVVTTNSGSIIVDADAGLTRLIVTLRVVNVKEVVAAHLHCNIAGANGPLALGFIAPGPCAFQHTLPGNAMQCTLTNADIAATPMNPSCEDVIGMPINNVASLVAAIEAGAIYANVHTTTNPAGEIRGQLR